MTTTSTSVDPTGRDGSGRKVWLPVAAGLAVVALVLSSLAITEVTRAASLVTTRSGGTAGVFVVRDCQAGADGLDPRVDHATCDATFLAEEGTSQPTRATVTVRRPPPADRSRPVEGRVVGIRGWGDDVSAPAVVSTAVVVLLLALLGWAGVIHAYRKAGGGRRSRRAGLPVQDQPTG